MRIEEVPAGAHILIDSTVFIYHFTSVSADCRDFLERCERGEVRGLTTVTVLAEVLHRLMIIEAVQKQLVTPGHVARKLREKPSLVKRLDLYQEQVARIPLMGIEIMPIDLRILLLSAGIRRQHGLLVNDSVVAAAAIDSGAKAIASADRDLRRVKDVSLYTPTDIRL